MSDAPTLNVPAAEPRPVPRRAGAWVAGAALALAVLAGAVSLWTWQRLARTQEELARRSAEWQAAQATTRALAEQAQATVNELQARLGVAEVKLSEVALQRAQLEELMRSVSRSRDDALVQELEAALRLAVQQSQLTGSIQPVVTALQVAQQRIERAAQPRLNPVQRAIARDLGRIRSAALVDVPALVMRLDELARAVDEWPLRADPPRDEPPVARDEGARRAAPKASEVAPLPAVAAGGEAASVSWWARVQATAIAWGQTAWARLRAAFGDLVRIRRIDVPEAVLLAPEEAYFLRENVRLTLLNARLAVLARQFDSARADVRAVERHLRRYFDIEAPRLRPVLQTLDELQRDLRHETLPRPDDTLAALAAAAEGR
ncbi:MAG: uroporphyrinogen-III C-methyltransferase [Tepidimonas taiwanensis]|nr:uroporphyrinogen-III C-methyltransferase [Tepidimonas taiwanensis]